VVARADRSELARRQIDERALRGERRGADLVDDRVVDARGAVAPDPERDAADDLVHHVRDRDVVVDGEVRTDRLVAAGNVVADARRRDAIAVGDDSADRLRVPRVVVCAEDGEIGAAGLGAEGELVERTLIQLAERGDAGLSHGPPLESERTRGGRPDSNRHLRASPARVLAVTPRPPRSEDDRSRTGSFSVDSRALCR
jgi:hypothetical protein